jgi:enoyl-CoA hydratase/carnithine racemase
MGGGFETALSCDIIIAAQTATFALPEVKVGFMAAASGIQRLSRYIGRVAAQEMMLTGRRISASEALNMGIVNAVTPDKKLIETALNKAQEIALGGESHQAGVERSGQAREPACQLRV